MEAEEVYVVELNLPEDLLCFVMEQVCEGGYANPSEYIKELILAHKNVCQ
jgi:Arc/MetJ-type ribon-helix-helix transcriptional regulator